MPTQQSEVSSRLTCCVGIPSHLPRTAAPRRKRPTSVPSPPCLLWGRLPTGSLEEVFLTVEPVRDGRPAVATGNVVGSMIFFVTTNVGVLALIQPLQISSAVWTVQYLFFLAALAVVLLVLYRGVVSRPIGVGLIGMYGLYWVVNYLG
ncbi:hypothetical protein EFA46_015500 (plasmid) [Halarchaeum sp. CBA1220]|nr:hypothetical protein EFA46_015500 [Halarchaeum sp. CBA1220]